MVTTHFTTVIGPKLSVAFAGFGQTVVAVVGPVHSDVARQRRYVSDVEHDTGVAAVDSNFSIFRQLFSREISTGLHFRIPERISPVSFEQRALCVIKTATCHKSETAFSLDGAIFGTIFPYMHLHRSSLHSDAVTKVLLRCAQKGTVRMNLT